MELLDCDTLESATTSVAALLQMSPDTLAALLGAFDYDALNESDRRQHPYEDLLVMHVCRCAAESLPVPHETCWFHATRVSPGSTFAEGILPLPAMLDRIWSQLGTLTRDWSTEAEWARFRREMRGQGARQYGTKLAFQPGGGPFAFLVRPLIFQPRVAGNHDYLGVPEIVEDICLSYREMHGCDLQARFVEATRPCIVKFRSAEPWYGVVRAALMFIHTALRGQPLSIHCSTCYSGEGAAVPRETIMRIDWPDESSNRRESDGAI